MVIVHFQKMASFGDFSFIFSPLYRPEAKEGPLGARAPLIIESSNFVPPWDDLIWLLKWCKNVILHNIYSINPFVYAIKTFMHSIIQHVDAIIAFVDSILQHVYAIKAFMHLIIQYGWEIVLPLCSFTQTDYVIKLSISTKQ